MLLNEYTPVAESRLRFICGRGVATVLTLAAVPLGVAGLLTLLNLYDLPGGLSGHGPVDGAPWLFAAAATMLLGRVLRGVLSGRQPEEDAVATVQDGGWRGAQPAAEVVAAHRRRAEEAFVRRYGD